MFLGSSSKFRYMDDWENLMYSSYEIPIEYDGYLKKVSELKFLKEIVDILTKGDFEQVKRSESRRKHIKLLEGMQMYYNIIFSRKSSKVGYGALVHFPKLAKDSPERSGGIVLSVRMDVDDSKVAVRFEKAKFDDFLIELKPYIDLLGDLYRKTRKP